MKRWERIGALILVLFGMGAALGAWRMDLGNFHQPGPGFFPFWLSGSLALISSIYLFTQLGPDPKSIALWAQGSWVRPALATGIMLAYTQLLGWTGFFSATFILFIAWLIVIEREKWRTVGLVSVLGTACLYFIFTVFLKIPLPKGLLF